MDLLLAAAYQDLIERWAPVLLLLGAVAVLVLRGRERRRGPDDDEPDELQGLP